MPLPLPPRPDLQQLRKQAKELLRAFQSGDADALKRFQEHLPDRRPLGGPEGSDEGPTLADAQCVLAREYGFTSWTRLKEHVESALIEDGDPIELLKKAFHEDDAVMVRRVLARRPELRSKVNEPILGFDSPPITCVRSRPMLDVLLEAGADIDAKSRWWAGGFGLLHTGDPDLAAYAIERGAKVDVHAAARLGLMEVLRRLVTGDPSLVHARGGDGQTPLHFARTLEIAEFLVDHGADPDARDVDHESTPAQYMIRDRQDIARFLVRRGCRTDVLMAAALGDMNLVRRHLDADPGCVRTRVSPEFFPMTRHHSGGTIYQWTLGWFVSPHEVARQFGHREVEALLLDRSPVDVKLLDACWSGNESAAQALLRQDPGLVAKLSDAERRHVSLAARNNATLAVHTMLRVGFPVDATGQHRGTPLHWAAFHGNADMVRSILQFNPPLEVVDADFQATPLGWAIHGSTNGWHARTGNYAGVVELLLKAGAVPPARYEGRGTDAVKEVLRRHAAGA